MGATLPMKRVLVAAVLLAACGGGSEVNCPNVSQTCPSPAPSFASDVRPIINARCVTCHSPGGQEAVRDYTTYSGVFAQRQPMLTQVYSCRMPPAGNPQPTTQERQTIISWLVCGAPNN